MVGLESLLGRVTGSFSESPDEPVSFWTRSLKVFGSAWTKVVGAGDVADGVVLLLVMVFTCLSIFFFFFFFSISFWLENNQYFRQ